LTQKGAQRLREAQVVVYDALVPRTLLEVADPSAELVHRRDIGDGSQEAINKYLMQQSRHGKQVVRLKGGDPFVFGRGGEEALAMSQGQVPFEVVPGVSAGIAVPAYAGIPLTHRTIASNVTFVTGHEDPSKEHSAVDWQQLVRAGGTLVIFMGVKSLAQVMGQLMTGGVPEDTPVAVIEWGTTPRQHTVVGEISDIEDRVSQSGLSHPALIVVGRVVTLRDDINWLERRPLWGRRVLVTRAREQAPALVETLREEGAGVICLPVIEFTQPSDLAPLNNALAELQEQDRFDWVLFTSANAVRKFCDAAFDRGLDLRCFGTARIACVGPSTADALAEYRIQADLVPDDHRAEGMLSALEAVSTLRGQRFLFPRAEVGRDVLPDALRHKGGIVDVVPVYRTTRPQFSLESARHHVMLADTVTFTSPSSVRNLVAMLGEDAQKMLANKTLAAIGPISSKALSDVGLEAHVVARISTIAGLVDSLVDHSRV